MKGLGMDEAWNRWMRRFKRLLCTPMWKEWPADDPVNPRPASTNVAKVFLSDFSGILYKIHNLQVLGSILFPQLSNLERHESLRQFNLRVWMTLHCLVVAHFRLH